MRHSSSHHGTSGVGPKLSRRMRHNPRACRNLPDREKAQTQRAAAITEHFIVIVPSPTAKRGQSRTATPTINPKISCYSSLFQFLQCLWVFPPHFPALPLLLVTGKHSQKESGQTSHLQFKVMRVLLKFLKFLPKLPAGMLH